MEINTKQMVLYKHANNWFKSHDLMDFDNAVSLGFPRDRVIDLFTDIVKCSEDAQKFILEEFKKYAL